jgi:small subunit ribosomal protein S2
VRSPNPRPSPPKLTPSSLRCIQVIAGVLGRAGEAGQKKRLEAAERGKVTYRPADNLVLPEALQDKTAPVADEVENNGDTAALMARYNRQNSNPAARGTKNKP